MRWQQKLRVGIAIFGVGFVVLLFFAMRNPRPREQARGRVARVDPSAAAESTNGEVRRFGVSGQPWRIEFEHQFGYADGRQKLTGARVFVDKRAGRSFKITASEMDVGATQEDVQMRGAVELTTSDGLIAKTEHATYNQREGVIRAPGATSFSRARVSGTSIGMTYDEKRDVLWLLDQAVMKMLPDDAEGQAVDIAAGAAGFARADHYVRYERGFKLVTGARVLTSDLATAYLTDDESKVETLEMRGNARITGVGEGTGALRSMQSDDINLEFAGDGRRLKGATLSSASPNRATLDLATADSGDRRVSGQWIDVRFSEDGATVSALIVREGVDLTLPATATEPARTITSSTLTAQGKDGKPLNTARFKDAVEYREQRPKATPRVVRSRVLDLLTQPGLGAIDNAHFTGAVRFEDDQTRAAAGVASYFVTRGVVELDGIDETTGLLPRVVDPQVTIEGRHIELTLEGEKIKATQDVRSVSTSATQPAAKESGPQVRRAGMLKQDQPVYATANELNYDSTSRLAVYTSTPPAQARLWQGDTTIMGDTITIDDATGNLTAKGKVASTLMLEQVDDKTKQVERVSSVASAGDMLYEDALHRATYTGTAHVGGPQGDLRGEKIELYLKATGNELDRVEAYTSVTMRDALRTATGDRLSFFSDQGRYVIVGAPVQIVADCRETTGRTLTFFKSTNNIIVDPNDELRTQTKPIPGCVAPVKH